MENREIKENIEKLKHGECFVITESDYGGAEIWKIWDNYFLFEIPTFGGTPIYVGRYSSNIRASIDMIIKMVNSWT